MRGGDVNVGGSGEGNSLRHLSASESQCGDGGWSPNYKSSGRSPQPRSSLHEDRPEGTEEATLMGLEDMASSRERVTGASSLLGRPEAWGWGDTRGGG